MRRAPPLVTVQANAEVIERELFPVTQPSRLKA
jgi:hypothetical protein